MTSRTLTGSNRRAPWPGWILLATAALLVATLPCSTLAQAPGAAAQSQPPAPAATPAPAKQPTNGERRRAAKLFLASTRLFQQEQFLEAMQGFERAAALDPGSPDYALAAQVARSHAVTALIQAAAKARVAGDAAAARAALDQARVLDPKNQQLKQHMNELGDDVLATEPPPLYEAAANRIGAATVLTPASSPHSFHQRTDQRQMVQQVFRAYGIEAVVDDSVRAVQVRFDLDNASFEQAARMVGRITSTFYVPLDARRVLVARDTRENRQQYMREEVETVYLSGLSTTELTEVVNLAKNVFDVQQAVASPTANTITLRGPDRSLNAFNSTMRDLLEGRNQVMLEVRLIQLSRTNERKTGTTMGQQMSVFNVYAEAKSILDANQELVQQIINSGLAAPGDYLKIIAILLASGQVSSPIFSGGVATFGGSSAATAWALSPGKGTLSLNINSSASRELDDIQLRLGDGEASTLRTGMRYPIQTSSYSNYSGSASSIAGLSTAGNSSSLASLLASYSGSASVPQVEYQDLGLTLKTTPKVLRDGLVALSIEMKIDALSGSALNGNPILNNRAYSGVVTLKEGETVIVASELSKQESLAVSGAPGLGEIPGLNNISSKDKQLSYSSLLIVMTPHLIRGTQAAGHTPMMRIEPAQPAR